MALKGHSDGLPTTRDVLCEHIFAKVKTQVAEHADHITGMVTDAQTEVEIKMLLENEHLLQQRVHQALQVLASSSTAHHGHGSSRFPKKDPHQRPYDSSSLFKSFDVEKEKIGNILFDKVAEIETELCAQISGMLLEMDMTTLHTLLDDPAQLEVAVMRAKCEYLREHHPHTLPSREELGHDIYNIVEQTYPAQAAKITGMLLELDEVRLQQLLDSPTELDRSIKQAHTVLGSGHPQ